MKSDWYTVTLDGSFYEDMTGRVIGETNTTMMLEFKLHDELGGTQSVQFFKEDLVFHGQY